MTLQYGTVKEISCLKAFLGIVSHFLMRSDATFSISDRSLTIVAPLTFEVFTDSLYMKANYRILRRSFDRHDGQIIESYFEL